MLSSKNNGSAVAGEAAWQSDFQSEGYVVLRGAWSQRVVTQLRTSAAKSFAAEPWLDPNFVLPAGTDLWEAAEKRWTRLAEVCGHYQPHLMNERIVAALSKLMADEPAVLSGITPFRVSPSQRRPRPGEPGRDPDRNAHVHSFSHFEPSSGSIIGWFAIEDISPDAGPMWIEPGSHLRNETLFDEVLDVRSDLRDELARLRNTGATYAGWGRWMLRAQAVMSELLEKRIDDAGGTRVPVLLKAGDLLLFHNALTHGTLPPRDRTRTRWSLLARYQGLNTKEYGWPSWLEAGAHAPALARVPPARYAFQQCGSGWQATNFDEAHDGCFWKEPLDQLPML